MALPPPAAADDRARHALRRMAGDNGRGDEVGRRVLAWGRKIVAKNIMLGIDKCGECRNIVAETK